MAKIAFSKFGLNKEVLNKVETISFNDQEIEVKQYLPINEKAELVAEVLNNSVDDSKGYYNELHLDFWIDMEFIFYYTNISFTEKQKEDMIKLHSLIEASGLLEAVKNAVPAAERLSVVSYVKSMVRNVSAYRNSALGIMENIVQDYSDMEFDTEKIKEDISNPENLKLLKEVVTKLG